MGKHKTMTPQEIYKARKQREEEEKLALLPPGLINQGNTCFMNSVLQGLIATRLLSDLFQFKILPQSAQQFSYYSAPIASRRSPLLTNGHGLGGEYDEKWVEGMPLGDSFLRVMMTAWNVQQAKRRESLNPKSILVGIGKKYDQYLDFAQQDAHEFLRQLLDAMRMEELDIIKKRRPSKPLPITPSPSDHAQSNTSLSSSTTLQDTSQLTVTPTTTSSSLTPSTFTDPDSYNDPPLTSFVDMLFGGRLTSILVCQKCKHISQTYEDFNDLSLSIDAGDRDRDRKRYRLKDLAKKLKTTMGMDMQRAALGMERVAGVRSSSVPPSPHRRESEGLDGEGREEGGDTRRRSLDIIDLTKDEEGDGSALKNEIVIDSSGVGTPEVEIVESEESASGIEIGTAEGSDEGKKVPDRVDSKVEFLAPIKDLKKVRKEKDDDGWSKLGRRISMTVGFGMGAKEKSRERRSRSTERAAVVMRDSDDIPRHTPQASSSSSSDIGYSTAPESTAAMFSPSSSLTSAISAPTIHAPRPQPISVLPPLSSSPSTTPIPSVSRFPGLPRVATTSQLPSVVTRATSPQPPKPSSQEAAYLRKILADIVPASSSSQPFTMFKQHPPGTNPMWMKMAGIEECLRMFTAVEVLEGENKVGCRRCWKLANGVYARGSKGDDSDEDDDRGDDVKSDPYIEERLETPSLPIRPASAPSTPMSPYVMLPSMGSSTSLDEIDHVFGTPVTTTATSGPIPTTLLPQRSVSDSSIHSPVTPPTDIPLYGGVIPSISTTAPQSPAIESAPNLTSDVASRDSLQAPRPMLRSRRRQKVIDTDSTDDSSDAESDASEATSTVSDESSSVSVPITTHSNAHHQTSKKGLALKVPTHRIPKSKQVIMSPAYKRYLIASPPPILVIHLKRFQQLTRTPVMSFSHGFKKLDDYVAFPEELDLGPFLAPRREDFGLKEKRRGKGKMKKNVFWNGKEKGTGRCMYRLYAVVVHIGNIVRLGGHYIAYTALPPTLPTSDAPNPVPANGSSTSSLEATHSPRLWAYISDTVVRITTLDEVLKAKAYICMYERI